MKKKVFQPLEFEIIWFKDEDVIRTSPGGFPGGLAGGGGVIDESSGGPIETPTIGNN